MPSKTYRKLVAIVGRPNVGKSTLFNRIIRSRKSLVYDEPGITRDRIFGRATFEGQDFYLCDTGGFEPSSQDVIKKQLVEQAELAIEEADVVIFVVDGREGMHPVDAELVRNLRKAGKKFLVACNKCDLPKDDLAGEDFRKLGVEKVFPVSAEHNRGVGDLLEAALESLDHLPKIENAPEGQVKLALLGRPNVGKSSILNRIFGESRSIVDDKPGTTRDTVDVELRAFGRDMVILDTAGIRRKSRMSHRIERFSAIRSLTSLEECDVACLVIDAKEGPTEGDARVAGYAFELRKPILIVVNKWDLLEDKHSKSTIEFTEKLHHALKYIRYAPVLFTSALENQRVSKIVPKCLELYDTSNRRVSTSEVNRALKEVLVKHTPPLSKGRARRIKFLYATQVSALPPRFVIFCSHPQDLHFSYKRFVENEFRSAFGFDEVPIALHFRERTQTKSSPQELANEGRRIKNPIGIIDNDVRDYVLDEDEDTSGDVEIEFADDGEELR
jgi:GTPase